MTITVGDLAKLTGVTVRALHHYDEIGLCRPSQRNAAGYRLYTDDDVQRLQQVLVLRDLGLPLEEIKHILDEGTDRTALLREHRDALVARRDALDQMIHAVDAAEAEQRWGDTEQFRESARRTKSYTPEDWQRYKREAAEVNARIAGYLRAGVPATDPQVQAAVEAHRLLIDTWFYPCSVQMHKALGQMYVSDHRFRENLDKLGDGYAQYLSDAIAVS